jgi:hypothetical protein
MDHTVPFRFSGYSGMDVGQDNGLPVDRSYADKSPFAFTGQIHQVSLRPSAAPDSRGRRGDAPSASSRLGGTGDEWVADLR